MTRVTVLQEVRQMRFEELYERRQRRHEDGSTHEWVPGCQWDLIMTLDDATTELYSAFVVEEEGTMSRFQGQREVLETKGLFSSL